ncbi:GMC family oxidoreductase N-terminal domain-containing protein [Luteimonas sp. BDR2-5]|uniref:GMC family oxidoreductase n=1 Tax=Proluteimonas luteida TaxID=2878685 RepID=UPI001E412529|nr:GMC family oxidoreductase N-terminal domain-containing protein [Luteimonas sp. BDR2-5]MCD9028723.1 GMC family oxidoreductase N-terminal domain-containing protein [Luteimonas sp. BDR2-5]
MASADNTYDYIVVGAGSAGCVVASRLSEDADVRVLVLEAGGNDSHPLLRMPMGFMKALFRPEFTWPLQTEPEPYLDGRRLPLPRGKVLGGSSSINGMFYMRGHPRDFDEWRDLGCEGWGFEDVLPYFRRSEDSWRAPDRYHSRGGALQVRAIDTAHLLHEPMMRTAAAAGYATSEDIDGDVTEGFARGDVTIDHRGRRASAARAFLHPAMRRSNLTVRTRATTARVLVEQDRATGVEYRHGDEVHIARATREVILCGGAYNSPQLLMLSGIGPPDELRRHGIEVLHALPGVGGNLSEHPRVLLQFEATRPVTFLNQLRFDRALWSALRWSVGGGGPFATQINSCNIVIRTAPGLDRPDIQLCANPVRMDAGLWFPGVVAAKPHRLTTMVCLLHPVSRGRVGLHSADPAGLPRIELNLFAAEEDFATMRRGIRAARDIYRTAPQSELTGEEIAPGPAAQSDAALDAFIRATAGVTQHPVGTCRMGTGDDAVVDPQLRVRGIRGLRVADASIMPTVPGANTNAAAIMIGEKAADLIRGMPAAAPS